jgi:intracellular sulfur oxidation DsrE/DsrF family protein
MPDPTNPPRHPAPPDPHRRRWLAQGPALAAAGTVLAAGGARGAPASPAPAPASARMPGDPPEHHLVYQLNRAEPDHIEHILNSIGAMIGRYEDNVALVVVAFGPGIHLLAKRPGRPVPQALRDRARSQARDYGVRFVACGNTMQTLGWSAAALEDYAQIEPVGAATLMELQERGYAYIAW